MATGFQPTGYNLNGQPSLSTPLRLIITNSETIVKGQPVKDTTGFALACGVTDSILGVCIGFVDSKGLPISKYGSESTLKGTFTNGGYGVESYAAAADNQTVDKVYALINIDRYEIYKCVADATLGSTTGSNLYGYCADSAAGLLQLDENDAKTTTAQWKIVKVDPDVTNGLYVVINESKIFT